jgi:hypothetical protein
MRAAVFRPASVWAGGITLALFLSGAGRGVPFRTGDGGPTDRTAAAARRPAPTGENRYEAAVPRSVPEPSGGIEEGPDGAPAESCLVVVVTRLVATGEESINSEIVAAAEVEVLAADGRSRHGKTGDTGIAVFEGLPPGPWTAVARAPDEIGEDWGDGAEASLAPGVDRMSRIRLDSARRLAGVVLSEEDGLPVAGAEVDVLRRHDRTGEGRTVLSPDGTPELPTVLYGIARTRGDGRFEIPCSPAGDDVLVVGRAPGFAPAAVLVEDSDVGDLEIRLCGAASARGTVRRTGGGPVPGARVLGDTGRWLRIATHADDEGCFALGGLPAGRLFGLQAKVEGLGATREPVETWIPDAGGEVEQDLVLRDFGGITVRVLDPSGGPVKRATFEWNRVDSGEFHRDDLLGTEEGVFLLAGLLPGAWRVQEVGDGGQSPGCSLLLDVPEGETVRGTMRISEPAAIEGHLFSFDGIPATGEQILAVALEELRDGRRPHEASAEVQEDGSFRIEGLGPGPHRLVVRTGGWWSEKIVVCPSVEAPSTGNRIVFCGFGGARFRLDRVPAEEGDSRIWAFVTFGGGDEETTVDHRLAESGGGYTIPGIPAGTCRLDLVVPGFAMRTLSFECGAGQETELGEIALDEGVEMRGRVVDDAGEPLPGSSVGLAVAGWLPDCPGDGVTDEEGRFVFRNAPVGGATFRASQGGAYLDDTRAIDDPGSGEVLFVLPRLHVVRVLVRTRSGRPVSGLVEFLQPARPGEEPEGYGGWDMDSHGRFEAELPAGEWGVRLVRKGLEEEWLGTLEVRADGERDLEYVVRE